MAAVAGMFKSTSPSPVTSPNHVKKDDSSHGKLLRWSRKDGSDKKDEDLVREASNFLWNDILPTLTNEIRENNETLDKSDSATSDFDSDETHASTESEDFADPDFLLNQDKLMVVPKSFIQKLMKVLSTSLI